MRATAIAILSVGSVLALFAGASYSVGLSLTGPTRFLWAARAPTATEAAITFPIEYALHSTEANDVVFLGDSACRHGIDIAAFQRATGLRAYNLGTVGAAGVETFQLTARAYLANHPAPRLFVVCMWPISFAPDEVKGGDRLPRRFAEAYGPSCPQILARRGAASLCKSLRVGLGVRPPDVRDLPLSDLRGDTYRTLQRRIADARGYWPLSGHGAEPDLSQWRGQPILPCEGWGSAFEELASRAPVVVRLMPVRSDLKSRRDFPALEHWVTEIASGHVFVARPASLWFDSSLCWDHAHLNDRGVSRFMPIVLRDVQEALNPPAR
jgi:hypothetical protein